MSVPRALPAQLPIFVWPTRQSSCLATSPLRSLKRTRESLWVELRGAGTVLISFFVLRITVIHSLSSPYLEMFDREKHYRLYITKSCFHLCISTDVFRNGIVFSLRFRNSAETVLSLLGATFAGMLLRNEDNKLSPKKL
jgi:hypothetical protein